MSRPERHIGISLGQLGSFKDGLGEFCNQLCTRMAAHAERLHEERGIRLWIHLNQDHVGRFGPSVGYIPAERSQRRRHLHPQVFELWHSLHQLNRLRPPQSCARHVLTLHDLNFLYFKNAYSRWRDRYRLRTLLGRTDEIVTITHYVEQDVLKHLRWSGPIQTIHNGVTDLSQADREPVELPSDRFLFHISRMAPSKNMAAILNMAQAWPERPIVLAGPESVDVERLRKDIHARGLRNITLLTDVSEAQKAWLFAHCDGLVFPSLAEGFGLPVIEAMYFGKPVFLSRLTALPEVGGALAHYFDSFEPGAMRAVIEQGLRQHEQPGASEALIAWARQFSWERCAQQYLALYTRSARAQGPLP